MVALRALLLVIQVSDGSAVPWTVRFEAPSTAELEPPSTETGPVMTLLPSPDNPPRTFALFSSVTGWLL